MDDKESVYSIETIFERLSEKLSLYEYRPQQMEMAQAIDRALKGKKTGIFEAGTGTGKSMAALIPAAICRKRVVVSTATIALQEQYIQKDIPLLQELLPFPVKASLIKGRGNYIGLRRLNDYKTQYEIDPRIWQWLEYSTTGDRTELDFVLPAEQWSEIRSDTDDCLRNRCPNFSQCYYFRARKEAENSDILVVNHALLLIDAVSGGSVLPPYDVLIVDEAHQLPEIATRSFSLNFGVRGIRLLASKALRQVHAPPHLVHTLEEDAQEWFHRIRALQNRGKATRLGSCPDNTLPVVRSLHLLKEWLEQQEFNDILDVDNQQEKLKLKAGALAKIANNYATCLELFYSQDPNWVYWLERHDNQVENIELVASPLQVADFLEKHIFEKEGLESSIWMSATLATGGEDPFSYFKKQIGAPRQVLQLQVSSPFDYGRQSALYLPKFLPDPNDPQYLPACAEEICHILTFSQGRAFVLFTSYYAMNTVYQKIVDRLPYPCQKQGDMPRQKLIEWFKSCPTPVLFGTSSFWEGVSIDGSQLSCVIIDRIPFQVPEDPIYEAKCENLKNDGSRSWFAELALPYAIMRLKQGAGRLIRTRLDTGVVCILDPRLKRKPYGREIISCLPPMPVIDSLTDYEEWN